MAKNSPEGVYRLRMAIFSLFVFFTFSPIALNGLALDCIGSNLEKNSFGLGQFCQTYAPAQDRYVRTRQILPVDNSHTRPSELECRHTYYIVMITMDYDHQFIIREMIKLWSKCVHSTPSNLPILFAHTQQFVFMLLGYPPLIWRILINGLFKWFHFPINSPPPTLWASCRLIFSLFSSPPRAQGSVTWWIKFHPSNSIIFPPIIAICIFPASHGEGNASLVDETTEKG